MTAERPAGGVPLEALLAHRAWVRVLARRLVADPNVADDIEQETWRAALEHPPRNAVSLRGWLGTAVRNAARMAGRSRSRRDRHETSAVPHAGCLPPDDLVAEAELQHRLVGAVLDLAEPYRSAVLQRYFEGREVSEIARRSGVPVETVRTRVRRGVALLRKRMGDDIGGDREACCLLCAGARFADPAIPPPSSSRTGPGTAGTTAVPVGAAGGMAMGLAVKAAVAAAALVTVFAAWSLSGRGPADARSDADVEFAGRSDGATMKPVPNRAGRAESERPAAVPLPAAGAPVDLDACDRDTDLHGVVVRRDGTPIAAVDVQAINYPWRRALTLHFAGIFEAEPGPATRTAPDGTFALRLRPGDNPCVRLSKPGFATTEYSDRQAGERVRFVLGPGVRLVVSARDEAGAAVEGVRLRVWRVPTRDVGVNIDVRGTTDASGVCEFPDLPGGAEAAVLPESRLGNVGMKRVALPESGELRLDLVLTAGRTITGRVTDASTGAPVPGARVGIAWPQLQSVTTSADGTYELPGWTGEGNSDIHATADGYARSAAPVASRTSIDFALRPGVRVRGRVVGPGGGPVGGACVSCIATWTDETGQQMSSSDVRTAPDGVFRLADLDRTRPHALTVVARDAGRTKQPVVFPSDSADELDVGDVILSAPHTIAGTAFRSDRSPAARIGVTLSGPDPWLLRQGVVRDDGGLRIGAREHRITDDLGRFRFPDVAPGTYEIAADLPGVPQVTMRVEVPAVGDVLDLRIPSDDDFGIGPLSVLVVDEAGAPVPGVGVAASASAPGAGRGGVTGADGRIVFQRSTKMRISGVSIHPAMSAPEARDRWLGSARVRTDDASPREVILHARRAARLSYVLLDPSGAPVRGAMVALDPPSAGESRGFTDASGRGALVVAASGTFALEFDGTVYEGTRFVQRDSGFIARIDGVSAGPAEVVLRCERVATGRTLTVRVLDPGGEPAVGVKVSLTTSASVAESVEVDATGRAHLTGLPARAMMLFLQLRPGDLHPGPRRVTPDGQEIVVNLPRGADVTGTVTWASGAPATGGWVQVIDATPGTSVPYISRAMLDPSGNFTVRVPADGTLSLEIEAACTRPDGGLVATRQALTPSDGNLRITLPR